MVLEIVLCRSFSWDTTSLFLINVLALNILSYIGTMKLKWISPKTRKHAF